MSIIWHVNVYFSKKEYQYYEYPILKASVATMQIKVMCQKAVHGTEPRAHFSQSTTCTLYITTVTVQRTDIHKTVTFFSIPYYPGFVNGTVNCIGYLYCFHWQVCTPLEFLVDFS